MDGTFSSQVVGAAVAVPVDHAHLARYTLGNRALEIEVLELFSGQAPLTFDELQQAETAKGWHVAAHTLKGSARAVGAWKVAEIAQEAETAGVGSSEREECLARLAAALEEVYAYVASLKG